jgi:predicted negative regulator of RcsB-dependent stress response
MTRFIGVVLVVPFGWNSLQNWRKSKTYSFVGVLLVPAAYIGWGVFSRKNLSHST